jgi:hypothetical protein
MMLPIPDYLDWLMTQSLNGTYAYMKQLLQYLQWQDGGKRGRPWIMKSPVHMGTVDLLLELFPESTLVYSHRDIHTTVTSTCRLTGSGWDLYQNKVDPLAVGEFVRKGFLADLRKHTRLRDTLGDRLQILDVQYEDVRSNAISVIEKIYHCANRELTPIRRRAMLDWEAAHPQHAAGKPKSYSLEYFGFTREEIDRECGAYIERFGHPRAA